MASKSLAELGPVCIVITGMPGAGKSTVAELVAMGLPRSMMLSGDAVAAMIVGGRVWALGSPRHEALAQIELINRNLAALARNATEAGFTAVIETVLPDRAEFDALTSSLACDVLLIVLSPGIEVCRARNATRANDQRWEFDGYEALEAEMLDNFRDSAWWFDTAQLGPSETAERIISEAHTRL
ncbi:AAA family ATPase [Microcella humidisoli]|uniref:ATP-binding protein n=1 Tax=Microcella humidisoli TaxID=2963406 RepID=A0ABY5FW90_9MICO|nr:AAA family ATPase [Microcella humidisoli]UTT62537.1 ATP-binding protein [Microcella humidisoli]UTT62549.1 ATP-binding protein [Microcella humidisoli]